MAPPKSSRPGLPHPVQVANGVVHDLQSWPVLPRVGESLGRRFPTMVRAERRHQRVAQPGLDLGEECRERRAESGALLSHALGTNPYPLRASNRAIVRQGFRGEWAGDVVRGAGRASWMVGARDSGGWIRAPGRVAAVSGNRLRAPRACHDHSPGRLCSRGSRAWAPTTHAAGTDHYSRPVRDDVATVAEGRWRRVIVRGQPASTSGRIGFRTR